MPKPVELTPSLVEARPARAAATAARSPQASVQKAEPTLPLQLRLPRDAVRWIKITAAEREQTISLFMYAPMQIGSHG